MLSKDVENSDQLWFRRIIGLSVKNEYIPIIIGSVISLILVFLLLIAYLLWRFFLAEKKEHSEAVNIETIEKNLSNNSGYSTVFVDPKNGQFLYNNRVIELIPEHEGSFRWLYKNHTFIPTPSNNDLNASSSPNANRNFHKDFTDSNCTRKIKPLRRQSIVLSPDLKSYENYSLPQISQFRAYPFQYTSSNIDNFIKGNNYASFKTRSLPSCVRFKKHTLATVDSAAELYDKVNFSKKRKNRMRNDEAAIIALSKSRSQFFNKDTDTLVDNEAVIVYDERTAL